MTVLELNENVAESPGLSSLVFFRGFSSPVFLHICHFAGGIYGRRNGVEHDRVLYFLPAPPFLNRANFILASLSLLLR